MRDGPLLLIHCQQVDSSPYTNRSSQVTCDHSTARWIELDHHDGIAVGFALLFGRFGVFVPDCYPSCRIT